MKTVILKKLTLTNFKGVKQKEINFNEQITSIFGDNETGKTTLFDAFSWLLTGKDSFDRQDFSIKTVTPDGSPIHHLSHEVVGEFIIEGNDVELKRCFKEKWVKKRGELTETFQGHET
ncbi:MAG: ATP-binding protein, partial [archaeon]